MRHRIALRTAASDCACLSPRQMFLRDVRTMATKSPVGLLPALNCETSKHSRSNIFRLARKALSSVAKRSYNFSPDSLRSARRRSRVCLQSHAPAKSNFPPESRCYQVVEALQKNLGITQRALAGACASVASSRMAEINNFPLLNGQRACASRASVRDGQDFSTAAHRNRADIFNVDCFDIAISGCGQCKNMPVIVLPFVFRTPATSRN